MKHFLGIDLGTSGVKVIIMNEVGTILGHGSVEQSMQTPFASWAEQEPEVWWNTTKDAIHIAMNNAKISGASIKGIGISGQMLGATLLNKDKASVRPCLLWCDQRSSIERDFIEEYLGLEYLYEKTGNYPLTGYWLPKLLWMKKNEPERYHQIDKVIFPKDYIRYKLTGVLATDVSDAGGSLLFDVSNRCWSWEIIDKFEFPRTWFVDVFESEEITGVVSNDVCNEFNFGDNVIVVGGGGDQTAGGIGNGIVEEGVVSCTIGTSGVVFACTDKLNIDTKERGVHSFCHSIPNKWAVFGCTLAAGGSFKWLRDNMAFQQKEYAIKAGLDSYDVMTLSAQQSPVGSKGLIFLPYMMGERTPYPDPYATGTFFGLTMRHNQNDIIRSVMEGITFSLRDSIEILKEFGVEVKQIRTSGGGGKSELWRQIQADIFNAEVITTTAAEGPGMGAAILAAVGAGEFKSIKAACERIIKPITSTEPIKENSKIYDEAFQVYRSLYPALKNTFEMHSKLKAVNM